MVLMQLFSCAGDLGEDVTGLGCPDEGSGVGVVHGDVFVDGGFEFSDAGEAAATDALVGDVAEEAFDHVQPRRAGGGEVHVKAPVLGEPRLHLGVFVGRVVIRDQVQIESLWVCCGRSS